MRRTGGWPRSLDWRFLLPGSQDRVFDHMLLLGGAKELSRLVLESGIARTVSRSPGEGRADAVVILGSARADVPAALGSLSEGGVAYWEIDRRRPAEWARSPARARALAERAGLGGVRSYWVKPSLSAPSMILPLDAEGALRWYLTHQLVPSNPVRMMLRRCGPATPPAWFARLVPAHVLTGSRGEAGGEEGLEHPLLLLGGEGGWSRVAVLPFDRKADLPRVVLKAPRTPRFNPQTEVEQGVLAEVRLAAGDRFADAIPEPLGTRRWRGLSVGVERYVPGIPIAVSSGGWRSGRARARDVEGVAAWLADFHRTTGRRTPWSDADAEQFVCGPCARYRTVFARLEADGVTISDLERRAGAVRGLPFARVWHHRDFNPHNVRRDGDRIAVVDWEVAREGPALADLLYFVLHWSWTARRDRDPRSRAVRFRELFLEPEPHDPLARHARAAIRHYLAALDASPAFLPLVLGTMLVDHALDRHGRLAALGDPASRARPDNPYVRLLELLGGESGDAWMSR